MNKYASEGNLLEDIPNICNTCGSIGHMTGRCTTDITHIIFDADKGVESVIFFSSHDRWQSGQEMKRVGDTNQFELYKTFPLGEHQFKFNFNRNVWAVSPRYPVTRINGFENNVIVVKHIITESFVMRSFQLEEGEPHFDPKEERKYEVTLLLSYISLSFIQMREKIAQPKLIEVWGEWNNWVQGSPMTIEANSQVAIYRSNQLLKARPYHYKFRIDGIWGLDPYRLIVENGGVQNHLINISEMLLEEEADIHRISPNFEQEMPAELIENEQLSHLYLFGHTVNSLGGKLYIFGGQVRETFSNTTYVFDYKTKTVQNLEMGDANGPPAIAFHKTVTYGEKLILFGGHNEQISDDYHTYSVLNKRWTKYDIKKNPMRCEKYTVLRKKDSGRLYFFGGYFCSADDEAEKNFNDLYVLYLNVMKFSKLETIDKVVPERRCNHSAAFYGWNMFIFGGCQIQGMSRKIFNDVYFIDLFDHERLRWREFPTQGLAPEPRYAHACDIIGPNMFVYGGASQKEERDILFDDLWVLDIRNKAWSKVLLSIPLGIRRSYSAMCAVDGSLFIYGGKLDRGADLKHTDEILKITFK